MVIRPTLISLLILSSGSISAHAAPTSCAERLLPSSPRAATGRKAVTARDLVELRDFGRIDDGLGRPSFRVSPDGTLAALTLRRANPDTDDYCIGVVLVSLRGRFAPRLLDVGGTIFPSPSDVHGIPAIPTGLPGDATPIWSPDGRWLAFLRRDAGVTQIWRVGLDGKPATQLSHLSTEPSAPRWAPDGQSILFATRSALDAGRAAIEREGRVGFHYDERFWSVSESYPHPPLPLPNELNRVDLSTGRVTPVLEDKGAIAGSDRASPPAGASLVAEGPQGRVAWVGPDEPGHAAAGQKLYVRTRDGDQRCPELLCRQQIAGLWWSPTGELLILTGGNAENAGRMALYRWRPGKATPSKVLETRDWLVGCQLVSANLVCARETALHPRTLVAIDMATARFVTLYDPNPEFGHVRLGSVERLSWTDRDGVETYGDLVLPPSHRLGQKHPLIVVQYLSRGFLRGGIGDEYPIQLFAAHGFAVLSVQMPGNAANVDAETDFNERQRLRARNWSWRRRAFTALDAGVDAAIAKGVIEADSIGITGMSDGSSTVQFALINSSRFKAASVSTCCDDPSNLFTVGPSFAASTRAWRYPAAGDQARDFWKPQSLALNADSIRTPLLMQLPDGEFRAASETFASLQSHGAPVEMFVFPDERHTKNHPAHRLAIYARNVSWFDFWLLGQDHPELARPEDLARWVIMRATLPSRRLGS
ncbi:Atxe2 family lasso peptide isopeptidase [Sphingomonas canadensis]|uniref:Atxe2 family lasso peptide isopeptidase n=1 Tax=Sphingomonas canadensis TaxID=1219257 RepID=A0ABW3HAR7_9SPHN|nr:Atxe2 family lasso peptide isopeptidase [Sphingomonas canadensis]MCW3837227.1 Atxe2 family lasso peptide isopeptidase [Sphingomonas canadensis]